MKTGLLNPKLVGKYAYTAVVESSGFIIGRADYGVGGYTPMRRHPVFPAWDAAKKFADELNEREGLTREEALEIVFNTMR